jgi:hypothetical protein
MPQRLFRILRTHDQENAAVGSLASPGKKTTGATGERSSQTYALYKGLARPIIKLYY